MTLVEKFTEVTGWSTARKCALLAGRIALPFVALNLVLGHILLSRLEWVDIRWWDTVVGLFTLQVGVVALVAWLVARSGAEGRWVYFVFAVVFTANCAVLIYMLGSNSTPIFATLPLGIVVGVVWFDDAIGRFVIWLTTLAVLVVGTITLTNWLPYAPAVRDGEIAQQGRVGFTVMLAFVMVGLCCVSLISVWLMVAAARSNSVRLDVAHRQLEAAHGQLEMAHRQLSRAAEVIARYVPAEVAEDILSGAAGETDGYERRKLTVFFSDLVGFTDIADELEPEDLALVLNEYFQEMTAIARRHHGTVGTLEGDGLLILFGAPHASTDREHARNAVLMAADMHHALVALNARWRSGGITESLVVRMGINTGVVTIGHFGSPERMMYAALGKQVNVAARLQALCEPGRTVLSYATWLLVKDEVECRPLGPLELKGIHRPIDAYEVVPQPSPAAL